MRTYFGQRPPLNDYWKKCTNSGAHHAAKQASIKGSAASTAIGAPDLNSQHFYSN